MSRDQRVRHNWALLFACLKANQLGQSLEVVFTLAPGFLEAPMRHYDFMFRGVHEVERNLRAMGVALTVLYGEPNETLPEYAAKRNAGAIIADFSPLKLVRSWKWAVSPRLSCAFYEVDAHNIVPCWLASPKQEYAARTIRPKLNALREEFLTDFPEPKLWNQPDKLPPPVEWDEIETLLKVDRSIKAVQDLEPGEAAAELRLRDFVDGRLSRYADERNDPNSGAVSSACRPTCTSASSAPSTPPSRPLGAKLQKPTARLSLKSCSSAGSCRRTTATTTTSTIRSTASPNGQKRR